MLFEAKRWHVHSYEEALADLQPHHLQVTSSMVGTGVRQDHPSVYQAWQILYDPWNRLILQLSTLLNTVMFEISDVRSHTHLLSRIDAWNTAKKACTPFLP